MLIDTHCHLNFHSFQKDVDQVVTRAKNAGVEKIIIPGAKLDSSKKAVKLAQRFPNCFAAVGIHPHHAQESIRNASLSTLLSELNTLANNKKVVAIGEIGIDYYQYKKNPPITESDKSLQKEVFLAQLNLAEKRHLPVI